MAFTAFYPSKKKETFFHLLFLLLCCLIAYWPLAFNIFSLKNDALNYFLPVRYQISEAINNRQWPFWSPYFNLGYPLHGDMQSGVWNPIVQFLSLFGTYTLNSLQYETLLYVYLCGVGMYFLLIQFSIQKNIVLWAAVAYMLCGFNSDSAQFLNWISGASFLPFVFLFYHKTITRLSWKQAVFCSFFLYLLFVTAYPADFIITGYILFLYLLVHLYHNKKSRGKFFVTLIKLHLIIGSCFILLSLPAIISFSEFLKYSERGHGVSYSDAMSNPLHPLLIFSYVAPFGIWRAPFVSVTDPLERNCFFGIISFVFLIIGFFNQPNDKLLKFCKWAFIITVIFSFGEMGGLRPLTYYVLPLMNTFRHPANAKLFSIFFACIIAAYSLQKVSNNVISKRIKKISFYIVTGMLLAIFLFAFFYNPLRSHTSLSEGGLVQKIKNSLSGVSFFNLIFINALIQLPFLIVVYFYFSKKLNIRYLLNAGIINCILFTMLFQPFTVVKKDSAISIQNVLNKIEQKGYPLPDVSNSLKSNSQDGEIYFKEIGAANMYNKKVGRIDYRITPSNLNTQNEFWLNGPLRNKLMKYPIIYAADTAINISEAKTFDTTLNKKIIFIPYDETVNLINRFAKQQPTLIEIKTFTPNRFDFEIECKQPTFYNLFQNYYPRWDLYIDNVKTNIIKSNISFMGFQLVAGHHSVSFRYKMNDLIIAFFLSAGLSLLIIISGLIDCYIKSKIC